MDNATNVVETAQMILMLIYDEYARRRKMFTINDNYLKLQGSYLFASRREKGSRVPGAKSRARRSSASGSAT